MAVEVKMAGVAAINASNRKETDVIGQIRLSLMNQ